MELDANRLLTVAEAADRLGLPRMVVYRLVHSGELPAVGMGHTFRIPVSALGRGGVSVRSDEAGRVTQPAVR